VVIMLRQVWAVFRKDLTLELRTKEVLMAMLVFGVLVLVILNFSFESSREETRRLSPGILWVAFTFAGILGLNRSFALEKENHCLEGMLLTPMDTGCIYLGKWLSSTTFMLIAEAFLLPAFVVLFDLNVYAVLPRLLLVVLLGTSGFCAAGTLFSAVAINTKMREVMLPILVFPVVVPVLIAAVESSAVLLLDGELADYYLGLRILIGCNLIFVVISYLTFGYVLEE